MKFINENRFLSVLILCVLILGAVFYWFEWRPSKIRTKCNDSAFESSMASNDPDSFMQKGRMRIKEQFYKDCLRYEGLNE